MLNIPYKSLYKPGLAGLVIAFALFAIPPTQSSSEIIDGIAIIVNRDAVLVSEVNDAMRPAIMQYQEQYNGPELTRKLTELRETVINQAIETKLILQVAKLHGITANEKTVESRIAAIKKRFLTEKEFAQALASKGLTLKEYRDQVVEQALVQDTVKRVLGREITVQDDEIEEYYDAHPDEFETKPHVELAQIFLGIPRDGTEEEIEAVGERADQLRIQLDDGGDFSELAMKYSEGPYREKGGLIGEVGAEEILPDLETIAFALKTDEISPVARSAYGFHILKAYKASPARKIGFEEAKPLIEESIREKKRTEKYDGWIETLKEDSYIDIRI
jgi:parvulin-like peptidyl-prolyl isomerase